MSTQADVVVVHGEPDGDELAALVAALAVVRHRADTGADAAPRTSWRSRPTARGWPTGPDAWRHGVPFP